MPGKVAPATAPRCRWWLQAHGKRRLSLRTKRPSNLSPLNWATLLAIAVGIEFLLGVMAVLSVPLDRPSGWLPAKGEALYLVHSFCGLLLLVAAVALIIRTRRMSRASHIAGWLGFTGVSLAGVGGLLTGETSLVRFFGMTLMLLGALVAAFGYMVPVLLVRSRRVPAAPLG